MLLNSNYRDHSEGSDTWAVNRGWVAVTPLSLRSDVPLRLVSTRHRYFSPLAWQQQWLAMTCEAAACWSQQHADSNTATPTQKYGTRIDASHLYCEYMLTLWATCSFVKPCLALPLLLLPLVVPAFAATWLAPAQDPACALSDKQRSVIAGVVQHAARRAGLATYGLPGLC